MLLELVWEDNWKDYNKSPLQNWKNVKANCDIYEIPEGRFTLSI